MKRFAIFFGLVCLLGMSSCHSGKSNSALLSKDFASSGWERFEFINNELEIKKPTTYDLTMKVSFDETYPFDYLSVVFSVFDTEEHPLRSKSYKFKLKDDQGSWKSDLNQGLYTFTLPINSEMSFNEPGLYVLQLENRMPITPLVGIHHISIVPN